MISYYKYAQIFLETTTRSNIDGKLDIIEYMLKARKVTYKLLLDVCFIYKVGAYVTFLQVRISIIFIFSFISMCFYQVQHFSRTGATDYYPMLDELHKLSINKAFLLQI